MLKVDDIKGMDAKALLAKTSELRVDLFNMKMQKGTSGIEKSHVFKNIKKDIARLLTVANQKNK